MLLRSNCKDEPRWELREETFDIDNTPDSQYVATIDHKCWDGGDGGDIYNIGL